MKRFVLLAVPLVVLSSCNPYAADTPSIAAARAEVARHGYTVPPDWRTTITITSSMPEGDHVFNVVHFQIGPSPESAVFEVTLDRDTGKVDSFRDLRQHPASERVRPTPHKH